jgi:GNAT superfamily N-acetyltransferase
MSAGYTLVERLPSVAEYNEVRRSAGLTTKDEIAVERGLANSLFAVCVEHNGSVVAIGRVIGDGGLFYDIVDMAVLPEHQKAGIGTLIMKALLAYIDAHARPTSLICLMANRGIAPFYERFGFIARDPDMPGMVIRK